MNLENFFEKCTDQSDLAAEIGKKNTDLYTMYAMYTMYNVQWSMIIVKGVIGVMHFSLSFFKQLSWNFLCDTRRPYSYRPGEWTSSKVTFLSMLDKKRPKNAEFSISSDLAENWRKSASYFYQSFLKIWTKNINQKPCNRITSSVYIVLVQCLVVMNVKNVFFKSALKRFFHISPF